MTMKRGIKGVRGDRRRGRKAKEPFLNRRRRRRWPSEKKHTTQRPNRKMCIAAFFLFTPPPSNTLRSTFLPRQFFSLPNGGVLHYSTDMFFFCHQQAADTPTQTVDDEVFRRPIPSISLVQAQGQGFFWQVFFLLASSPSPTPVGVVGICLSLSFSAAVAERHRGRTPPR